MGKPTPVAEAQAEKKRRRTVEPSIVEDGGVADGLFDDFVSPFHGGTADSQAKMLERMQTVQRQDLAIRIGYAQGNRHLQRVITAMRQGRSIGPESSRRPAGVQAKLTVSEPDDQYEQEADQVADRVMKMAAPPPPPPPDVDGDNGTSPQTSIAQRLSPRPAAPAPASAGVVRPALTVGEPDDQYEQEADEAAEAVQRMPFFAPPPPPPPDDAGDEDDSSGQPTSAVARAQGGSSAPDVSPDTESGIKGLKGRGKPLPPTERTFFEERMGADFGDVRVHTGDTAVQTSRDLSARAYTVGSDIAFGAGEYELGTEGGRRLVAHELTHVVQQGGAGALQRAVDDESESALHQKDTSSTELGDLDDQEKDTDKQASHDAKAKDTSDFKQPSSDSKKAGKADKANQQAAMESAQANHKKKAEGSQAEQVKPTEQPQTETSDVPEKVADQEDLARDYNRIRKRATEDSGTAGDDGEETWAELLRDWLPPNYTIVTKGRLVNRRNITSPQVDVLVLDPTYPKALLNKKYYLADLVVAAFECKLTLKAEHIHKAVKTAAKIRKLLPRRIGSPYQKLYSPIIYGVLAHSHVWKQPNSTPIENTNKHLFQADRDCTEHPREMLDIVCIPDLATWRVNKMPPQLDIPPEEDVFGLGERTVTTYQCCSNADGSMSQPVTFTPIGIMFSFLYHRLAWEDSNIRKLAQYFSAVQGQGGGLGKSRSWGSDIYSDKIRADVMTQTVCRTSGFLERVADLAGFVEFPISLDCTKLACSSSIGAK